MREFKLKILTPNGEGFSGEVKSLNLRTTDGEVGILAGHTDYLAGVSPCVMKMIDPNEKTRYAFCGGGFFSVVSGEAKAVVDEFVLADELDEEAILAECAELSAKLSEAKGAQNQKFLKLSLARAEAKRRAIDARKDDR